MVVQEELEWRKLEAAQMRVVRLLGVSNTKWWCRKS